MDEALSNGQQSSLDSLRTVEFRQTLRGYHIDDVDEYLERVAIEADALQDQFRQISEQLRQAVARIAELEERQYEEIVSPPTGTAQFEPEPISGQVPVQAPPQSITDDTLQRTLLLAQKFVDETKADAETQARSLLEQAEEQVRNLIAEAEQQAKSISDESGRHLQEEVSRLESLRLQLHEETGQLRDRLAAERTRVQGALQELVGWIDESLRINGLPGQSPEGQETFTGTGGIQAPIDGQPSSGGTTNGGTTSGGEATNAGQAAIGDQQPSATQQSSGTIPGPGLQPFATTQFGSEAGSPLPAQATATFSQPAAPGTPTGFSQGPAPEENATDTGADSHPATSQGLSPESDQQDRAPQQMVNGNLF